MKKENGYYIDDQGNKWSVNYETEKSAQKKSKSLITCRGCSDCKDCSYCSNCSYCNGCSSCRDCSCCSDCRGCSDCNGCNYCRDCSDCSDCRDCNYCKDCRDCSYCRGCSDFEENPQRITSPKIGSRNDQTTVYWTDKKDLVVCGCFKGNLKEFEERVKEVHKDILYTAQYLNFIQKVKTYREN
jgi:hypothetical protein